MRKITIIILLLNISFLTILSINLVNAQMGLNLKPLDSFNNTQPNTYFNYKFDFTTNANCGGILLSISQTIKTINDGTAFTSLDISSLTQMPSYLCIYRNNILTDTLTYDDLILNSLLINNITATGNITASGFYYPNGTNIISSGSNGNSSWNQSLANSQYTNFSSFNSTQMSYSDGYINILTSWLSSYIATLGYLTSAVTNYNNILLTNSTTQNGTLYNLSISNILNTPGFRINSNINGTGNIITTGNINTTSNSSIANFNFCTDGTIRWGMSC